jgi:lysophospholipase L1-like esterase
MLKLIINRGFGGSTLEDLFSHKEVLFTTYKPKQIFVYCGENDVANKMPSIEVYNRWLRLYRYIRKQNKKAEIYFISLKPSPSRWHLKEEMQKVNEMIKSFTEKQSKTYFVDIWPMMLEGLNKPKSEIFLKDSLHMNKLGYDLWINELKSKIDCR